MVDRRQFLTAGLMALGGAGLAEWLMRPKVHARATPYDSNTNATVDVIQFDGNGARVGLQRVNKVRKSNDEWRKQLSPLQFEVTRQEGTETAFTGAYYNLHDHGIYRCVCCDNALFSSDTKFDSGTGWPSFWAPIAKENVHTSEDSSLGMVRSAVSCAQCDAHLGHVFDDGPPPTYLRYCMNSASLKFVKIR